jgi:hypothetical protein
MLGPASAAEISVLVSDAGAVVNRLTIDSTGDPKNPKSYTLTVGEETIDLSSKNLGPADVNFLAVWLQRPEVIAGIVHVDISQSKIGAEGGHAMVEALKTTKLESIVIGKDLTLPLKGELGSDSFDASGKEIDPGYAVILAWWLTTPVTAGLASLKLSGAVLGPIYETEVTNENNLLGGYLVLTPCKQRSTASMKSEACDDLSSGIVIKVIATETLDGGTVRLQTATGWLSLKEHLVQKIDTSKPCVFQMLCNALKASQVTEVDFSSCGLGSCAMEILSDYVRDAVMAGLSA